MKDKNLFMEMAEKWIKDDIEDGWSKEEVLKKYHDSKEFKEMFEGMIESTSNLQLSSYQDNMNSMFKIGMEKNRLFLEEFKKRWREGLILSESFRYVCLDVLKIYDQEEHDTALKKCLKEIFIRGCQIYYEVYVLILQGLTEGAWARWRTLFELSVIAQFMVENGEAVASEYLASKNNGQYYEWARRSAVFAGYNPNYNVTFKSIYDRCNSKNQKGYNAYRHASITIHAGAIGTFSRFGGSNGKTLGIGGELEGVSSPAIYSAQSLSVIVMNYLHQFSYGIYNIALIKTVFQWIEAIENSYTSIENEYKNKA